MGQKGGVMLQMIKNNRKLIVILAAIVTLLAVATGSTLAYLWTKTPPLENTIEPAYVSCQVIENFDGTTKTNVYVTNTSNVKAYIRVTVIANWLDENGHTYGYATPIEGEDYTAQYGNALWVKGSDGYYYYTLPVDAGAYTQELIRSLSPISSRIPKDCTLRVQIISSAIQAEPVESVSTSWGVTVNGDGTLSVK